MTIGIDVADSTTGDFHIIIVAMEKTCYGATTNIQRTGIGNAAFTGLHVGHAIRGSSDLACFRILNSNGTVVQDFVTFSIGKFCQCTLMDNNAIPFAIGINSRMIQDQLTALDTDVATVIILRCVGIIAVHIPDVAVTRNSQCCTLDVDHGDIVQVAHSHIDAMPIQIQRNITRREGQSFLQLDAGFVQGDGISIHRCFCCIFQGVVFCLLALGRCNGHRLLCFAATGTDLIGTVLVTFFTGIKAVDGCVEQRTIIRPDGNIIPLCFGTTVVYVGQIVAIVECIIVDSGNTFRDGDTGQIAATAECTHINGGYAVRKCIVAGNSTGRHNQHRLILIKQNTFGIAAVGSVAFINPDSGQAGTVPEGCIANVCHTGGDGDAGQAAAVPECSSTNGRHTFRNGNA